MFKRPAILHRTSHQLRCRFRAQSDLQMLIPRRQVTQSVDGFQAMHPPTLKVNPPNPGLLVRLQSISSYANPNGEGMIPRGIALLFPGRFRRSLAESRSKRGQNDRCNLFPLNEDTLRQKFTQLWKDPPCFMGKLTILLAILMAKSNSHNQKSISSPLISFNIY